MTRQGRGRTPRYITGSGDYYERERRTDTANPKQLRPHVSRFGTHRLLTGTRVLDCSFKFKQVEFKNLGKVDVLTVIRKPNAVEDFNLTLQTLLVGLWRAEAEIFDSRVYFPSTMNLSPVNVEGLDLVPRKPRALAALENARVVARLIAPLTPKGPVNVTLRVRFPGALTSDGFVKRIVTPEGEYRRGGAGGQRR